MRRFRIADLLVEVPAHIYPPSDDTFLLMKLLDRQVQSKPLKRSIRFLEVGCGSGLIAIYARRLFSPATIFATDISINALRTSIRNVLRNGENLKDYRFVNADLCHCFSSSAKFDYVLINPPYLPANQTWVSLDPLKTAVEGGPSGVEILNSFIAGVLERLSAKNIAYVYSTFLEGLIDTERLCQCGYEIQDCVDQIFANEKLTAILWKQSS
ncbi:MAG: methyltransferase [Candidatus Thorarchaeota archaeon]